MKFIVVLLSSMMIFSSCSMITGSGRIVSDQRNLESFTEIESAGSLQIEVTQGSSQKVEVEADDNVIAHIETKVKSGRLFVGLENGSYTNINVTIHVTMPVVEKLIVSGSGDIKTEGTLVNNESISLITRGSGSITAHVESPVVNAEIQGSGGLTATGRTKNFNLKNSGSGSAKCSKLLSENTKVENDGSGSSHVFASVSLDAELDGSGDVAYSGSPVTKHVNDDGSGSVREE